MPKFAPTSEQHTVLDLFATGENLLVEAGAGTGKTATLELLGNSTQKKGQYIAFNKAIVAEAGERMPGNVACSTAHSLAFRSVGKRYSKRLNSSRMKSIDIARRIDIDPLVLDVAGSRKVLSQGYLAGLTMRSIVRFCQTADEEPNRKHMPYIEGIDPVEDGVRKYINNNFVAKHIEDAMVRAWKDLTQIDGVLPFRHDHYLKMWQLSRPKIDADFIMFDEAQDANPVMVAVVGAQDHAQLVWVGDSQQQIYTFTGAVNALASMPTEHRAFLTQSFRFGPAVATVANSILELLDAELRLVGTDSIPSVVCPVAEPDAVLTRTNAEAVRHVLGARANRQAAHLVGGAGEIVSFAKAASRLMEGQSVDHPELACFDTWDEVRQYVKTDEQGGELRLMTTLVDEFTVPVILEALDRMTPEANADVIVSTAHKSKGRQWGSVLLGGDFPAEIKGDEELRLLYVAVTRAQRELDITNVGLLSQATEEVQS